MSEKMPRREEDYLEAIYNMTNGDENIRTTDLANHLKVKPASVTEMLQKLSSKGLIEYKKYGGVKLTKKGYDIGKAVSESHHAIMELLKMLQIPESIADRDACTMEHDLDPRTVSQLKKFVSFMKNCPKETPQWMEHFKKYSETGSFPPECGK